MPDGGGGYLVLTEPWPSMLRTIWGDDQRFLDTYWSRFEGKYFAGDGAKKDDDGDIWLLGRVDDVMLVSGHNISTTEVESALVSHPKVAEAAVVGATDPQTTQAICAFVILRGTAAEDEGLVEELRDHVAKQLGPIAKPKRILPVAELPKTRSGKIMRRLLRDVAENRDARRRHHAHRLLGHGPDPDQAAERGQRGLSGGRRHGRRPSAPATAHPAPERAGCPSRA